MPRLGTRKLHYLLKKELEPTGLCPGRDALFDFLRSEGLLVKTKRRYSKTTNSKHWHRRYADRRAEVDLCRPEQLWVADITYLYLIKGYLYLHLVSDAYSKKIMGYQLSNDLEARHSVSALKMALRGRKYTTTLIHHSDRGLQYCSAIYTSLLQQNHVQISMTQNGSPYDNAVAERINGILKDEYGLDDVFEDFSQAQKQVTLSINSYNERRPHLSNQFLTPQQMHQQCLLKPKKWNKITITTMTKPYGY